jgi:hypothetical protein
MGVALSAGVAIAIRAFLRHCGGSGVDGVAESARLAEGWMLAAGALTCLVLARCGSTLVRSPQLLRAATWATPIVLLLWLARFPERAGPFVGAAPCVALALALAATPLVTFLALRRGAEPDCPATLGAAAGAMCGAWAEVLVLLWCPVRGVAHGALAHALPVALLAAVGAVAGRKVLAFAPSRKPRASIDVYLVGGTPMSMRATGAVWRSVLRTLVAALGLSGCATNLSGPGMDVVGAPRAVTTDGRHVVATFDGRSGGDYERVAVELADVAEPYEANLTARR